MQSFYYLRMHEHLKVFCCFAAQIKSVSDAKIESDTRRFYVESRQCLELILASQIVCHRHARCLSARHQNLSDIVRRHVANKSDAYALRRPLLRRWPRLGSFVRRRIRAPEACDSPLILRVLAGRKMLRGRYDDKHKRDEHKRASENLFVLDAR